MLVPLKTLVQHLQRYFCSNCAKLTNATRSECWEVGSRVTFRTLRMMPCVQHDLPHSLFTVQVRTSKSLFYLIRKARSIKNLVVDDVGIFLNTASG